MFQRCELNFDGDIVVEDEVAAEENWLTKADVSSSLLVTWCVMITRKRRSINPLKWLYLFTRMWHTHLSSVQLSPYHGTARVQENNICCTLVLKIIDIFHNIFKLFQVGLLKLR